MAGVRSILCSGVSYAIPLLPPSLHGLGTPTGISLIAVQVQIVRASRRFDVFVGLDRFDPLGPPATLLRLRPASIRLQHALHPDHPRRELDIDKGNVGTKEEGTRRVCGIDNRADLVLEFFGVADLVRLLLRLEIVVERGDDMTVDLDDTSEEVTGVGESAHIHGPSTAGNERGLWDHWVEVMDSPC